MRYVYVIQSLKDGAFYTGYTSDLNRRIEEHNAGSQSSTKSRISFKLVYYEWCVAKEDALQREKYLKSGRGKAYLKERIRHYLQGLRGACPEQNL
jgi:putative endonuclease